MPRISPPEKSGFGQESADMGHFARRMGHFARRLVNLPADWLI
jgi:hypothetical protein